MNGFVEINGSVRDTTGLEARRLSKVLRDNLGLTGTKVGCNAGDCGACTVLIDGAAVCACLVAAGQVAGAAVETIEGLAGDPVFEALKSAFLRHGAAQCGICTPGMLVTATALLRANPHPDRRTVEDELGGVLCRCTGYAKIVDAVMAALALGQLVAMLAILLPFTLLLVLAQYERSLRIGAGLLVIGLGVWILATRRHPRFLARVPPHRLALWSFLVALAHGAALMLVPIYLGICTTIDQDAGHGAADVLMRNGGVAVFVALAHTAAMTISGGAMAWGVYRWFGLGAIRRSWFDLEWFWGGSLILVGALGLWSAL